MKNLPKALCYSGHKQDKSDLRLLQVSTTYRHFCCHQALMLLTTCQLLNRKRCSKVRVHLPNLLQFRQHSGKPLPPCHRRLQSVALMRSMPCQAMPYCRCRTLSRHSNPNCRTAIYHLCCICRHHMPLQQARNMLWLFYLHLGRK